MGAHTPGPWRIADDIHPSFLKVDGPSFKLNVVMWAAHLGESDYQSRLADLRLIAAAPDLLEALEDLIRNHKENKGEGLGIGPLIKAKAAIAKAKGEQPCMTPTPSQPSPSGCRLPASSASC